MMATGIAILKDGIRIPPDEFFLSELPGPPPPPSDHLLDAMRYMMGGLRAGKTEQRRRVEETCRKAGLRFYSLDKGKVP